MTGPDQVVIKCENKGPLWRLSSLFPTGSWAKPQALHEGGNAKRTSLPSQTQSLRRKSEILSGTGTLGEQT